MRKKLLLRIEQSIAKNTNSNKKTDDPQGDHHTSDDGIVLLIFEVLEKK
jgi:hypothetical protein